jgi:uncharacterized protein (TIGR02118 family)
MVTVHALYERKSTDERFDMEYLIEKRIPFVKEVLKPYGLLGITVHRALDLGAGAPPPRHHCVIALCFEDEDGLRRALQVERARMDAAIAQFTDIAPLVLISEVVLA